jgi:hypothetical protein
VDLRKERRDRQEPRRRGVRGPATAARLHAETVGLERLNQADRERMYQLMCRYYDDVARAQFFHDLSKKHAVIVLRDDESWQIQGFSTLVKLKKRIGGRNVRAIFSGDTIVEKRFWGQTALAKEFLRYLWVEKLRRPFAPLYWLLISKGYKAYLLMANNFGEHYPRFERPTPKSRQRILDVFCTRLYPGRYDRESGVIRFERAPSRLKEGVAPIGERLLRENPRVAHFQKLNPRWRDGEELACIARMTLLMPLLHSLKRRFKKRSPRASLEAEPTASLQRLPARKRET